MSEELWQVYNDLWWRRSFSLAVPSVAVSSEVALQIEAWFGIGGCALQWISLQEAFSYAHLSGISPTR